jgi:hypothetical protein
LSSGHRGTRAIERMVEHAPATGGLALWMRHLDVPAGDGMPAAATDGRAIVYAPAFDALPPDVQTGVVAHLVLHVALRHPQRMVELRARLGDVDARLFNTCADAIVNTALGHLDWLRLPDGSITLERLLVTVLGQQLDPARALLEWDVEKLYLAMDDRSRSSAGRPRQDGPRASKVRALGAGGPLDLRPGDGPHELPEVQAERVREWSERLLRAHASDGEFSMLRTLLADVPRARTPWEQALRAIVSRGLSTRPAASWSRPSRSWLANQGRMGPNRRMPWEPGTVSGRRVPRLALIVDVSGSIEDGLLGRFATEIDAITRRAEAGLVLVAGDDRVRHVEHRAPGRSGLRGIALSGGGGTDFGPLLREADAHRPDLGVVLTDLDGPAGFRPRWPVIWAVPPAHEDASAPFGRKLVLR